MEVHFESLERTRIFKENDSKEKVFRAVFNNGVLKALLRQSFSDAYSAKKSKA